MSPAYFLQAVYITLAALNPITIANDFLSCDRVAYIRHSGDNFGTIFPKSAVSRVISVGQFWDNFVIISHKISSF